MNKSWELEAIEGARSIVGEPKKVDPIAKKAVLEDCRVEMHSFYSSSSYQKQKSFFDICNQSSFYPST
jgi:hypothetical protein